LAISNVGAGLGGVVLGVVVARWVLAAIALGRGNLFIGVGICVCVWYCCVDGGRRMFMMSVDHVCVDCLMWMWVWVWMC
jgi:hypothetical protein